MTIKEIQNIIKEKYQIEEELDKIRNRLKEASNLLESSTLNDCDYETAKDLFKKIQYYIKDKNTVNDMSSIIENKKIEKYPALLKPTYYPEIDTLHISDSEKLRLDKAARWNYNRYINKNNCNKGDYPLSIEDLELLRSIHIIERKYNFLCEECNCSCDVFSESELEKYKRVWELEKNIKELTEEQLEELEKLYEDEFYVISLYCLEDENFFREISNEQELEDYKDNIRIEYKVVKQPNLKYENL